MAVPTITSATIDSVGTLLSIVWSVPIVEGAGTVSGNATRGVTLTYSHKATAGSQTDYELVNTDDAPRAGEPITINVGAGLVEATFGSEPNAATVRPVTNLSALAPAGMVRTYRTERTGSRGRHGFR
jgi:hypothetical protein